MKQPVFLAKMVATLIVLNAVLVVPIIIPRATVRTIFGCQSQSTGTITVIDRHGHTYSQDCDGDLRTVMSYPGLSPTEDTPWLVIITAQLKGSWLPRLCVFTVTKVPVHLQCGLPATSHLRLTSI